LPLPPSDVTSSEKTSSKDKAHILEGKSNVQKGRLMSFIW